MPKRKKIKQQTKRKKKGKLGTKNKMYFQNNKMIQRKKL